MFGHAGEKGFEAAADAGPFGVVGIVIGALLGWPHSGRQPAGTSDSVLRNWHNAFTSDLDLSKVVEAGLAGGGAVAFGCALLGYGFHRLREAG